MPSDNKYLRLRTISPNELRDITQWPDILMEDYLNINENIQVLANSEESTSITGDSAFSAAGNIAAELNAFTQELKNEIAVLQAKIEELSSKVTLHEEIIDKYPADNSHHNFSNRDYIDFNTAVTTQIDQTGRALWNVDDGTLNVGLYNDVVLQTGQEQHYYSKNTSGAQIDNGQPVMFAGAIGASGKLEIDLAESDPTIPAEYFMGVATQDIPNNDFGYVTSFGLVRGIDTTGTPVGEVWNDGDLLYLSTTAGELTITPPTAPDPKILVAAVIYSHAHVGSIFVRPTFGDYLSSLHDVYIIGVADNDLLAWNAANSRFENTSDPVVDTITVNTSSSHNGDSIPAYFGAGNDMSVYYDGTDGNIDTSLVAASDLEITCGSNKTIELQNVVYEDLQVSISNIRVPASSAPTQRLYNHGIGGGVTFPVLGFAVNDYIYFDLQTSHTMKLNTILDNHIHFMTPTDGSATPDRFQFQLDVIAAPINGNWAVPTGSPFTKEHIIAADYTNLHAFQDIADIPAVNTTVSTIYKCKLTRIAATQDEYGSEVYLEFNDSHYQKNTMGSRQEGTK
jgi:hypothetical protein